jgi:hypothetical protein
VLHVHDLVDYVSEEASIAGRAAVKFIRGEKNKSIDVPIKADGQIRYTVPQKLTEIAPTRVYFRVADVYRDKKVVVSIADKVLYEKKKQKLAPGEMETVELTEKMIAEASELGGNLEFKLV